MLNAFQRKVLRKINRPLLVNGQWQNRYHQEIYKLYKEMELTRNTRLRILHWVGHVMWMQDERVAKKALKGYIEGRRPAANPSRRWLDAAERDAKRML
jgi:hypothetical protein